MQKFKAQIYLLSIAFCALPIISAKAQSLYPSFGSARLQGIGYIRTVQKDINAAFGNQSGLTGLKGLSIIASTEQRSISEAIGVYNFGIAVPIGRFDVIGLQFQQVGIEGYSEQKYGLSYARVLGTGLSIGAAFDYYRFSINEYGSSGKISAEAGIQYQLGKQVLFGFHILNPFHIDLPDDNSLPTLLAVGIAYSPSDKVNVYAEAEKDIDFAMNLKAGIEYFPAKVIVLRMGFNSNPSGFCIGAGFRFGQAFSVDVANAFHPQLGSSPSFSLGYSKEKAR